MSLYVDIEKELSSFKLRVNIDQKNGILGFLGESGSGKSMTLKCIAGLEKPTRGKIILNDRVLFDSEKKINIPTRDRNVGFLFQNYALFPHMTVSQNIELGLKDISKEEKSEISKHYLEIVGLKGMEKRYPWQLSGGQQQRVALSRVLAPSPEILLLDEPFSALDHHLRGNMEKELLNLIEDYKGDILFVTHDIEEAYRVCDNLIVYDSGNGLEKRDKREIFERPKSYSEAKITGCKNISKAKKTGGYTVFAQDWNIELYLLEKVDDDIEYIGIREHDIVVMVTECDAENTFEFSLKNEVENPFNYTMYLRKSISKEILSDSNIIDDQINVVQVELEKNKNIYKENDSVYLEFPKDKLFCI
ncbi:sulfate/molybdate ABC transporter ATP-binding protein [Metaclostridioides mangenotii]|uniref:sulfate/molybdate ABC transporter ATP-binding protein n=1 Tax=Metaclostridioides mangenotii TaxID=1540 RepID=UPI0004866694|nr:sulfate/molybdate ABC transporter ATP-binding protein [Clostridioides mangenotii]